MGAPVFLGIAAVSSVLSGAVGYMGAQQQAKGLEAQAQSAQDLAAYNAQVQRNNAQAQAQDLQYQAGVAQFNQQLAQRQTAQQLQTARDKTRLQVATAQASAAKRGIIDYSFEDVLRSEAMLAEREEAEILFAGREQGYQLSTQADLNQLMAQRSIELGQTQAQLTIAEGAQTAFALQNQASSARIGGFGSLVGGIASGASYASQI